MSQRISLTRIVAINWYGFRQIFDVDENVLISGAFGTGKSAILDLMQYVLLGKNWRANRAAAGNARGRDIVGYCLGDTNQTRNGQRHFLRKQGVTIVALEFSRPENEKRKEPQRETWGIRIQHNSAEAEASHVYFCIPERIEYEAIAPGGKLRSEDDFRSWIRREYGNEFLFSRQQEYLEEMAAPRHLHFDSLAFRKTFPKAIAFELEDDVEKFIREFILEESPLDVREVRAALRAYDDTRKRLAKQEDEAAFLKRICAHHERYETSEREQSVLHHISHTIKLKQLEERHEKNLHELQVLTAQHEDDQKKLEEANAGYAAVLALLDEVRFEIQKNPDDGKIHHLEQEKRKLQDEVASLRDALKSFRQRLDAHCFEWSQWLKHGNALSLDGLSSILAIDDSLLLRLRSGSSSECAAAMQQLSSCFNDIWHHTQKLLHPLDESIKSANNRHKQVVEDLELLSKGRAPGSFPLFTAIQKKLGTRAEQLGRLIEVKPEAERWWPALELFLHHHRWTIVVESKKDYLDALKILALTPPGREREALLNPSEAAQCKTGPLPDSLFSKIEVTHPTAKSYAEFLLGEVLCVETLEQLEASRADQAITPEGFCKQSPVRRNTRKPSSVELTLGREGIERMRAVKQKEQIEIRETLDRLTRKADDIRAWLDSGKKNGLDNPSLPDRAHDLPRLPQKETELETVRQTIELLMTPEREERLSRLRSLETKQREISEEIGVLKKSGESFEIRARPFRESIQSSESEIAACKISVAESRAVLGNRFSGVLDTEIEARILALFAGVSRWLERLEKIANEEVTAGRISAESLAERNHQRSLLATVRDGNGNLCHPEYQGEFVADDPSNAPWASRLAILETVELEKSRQLASERKLEWERRLEDSVLNELNRRIAEASNTIRLLDRYMGQPVGKYRYRISQRKDTANYGSIWALLNTGFEVTDPLLAVIRDEEVEQAKTELMQAVNAADSSDPRASRILDYRNYHRYDIEMFPADKEDAPPISLTRSGRNLSGGESQVPFFISMLAAFRRVYHPGDRTSSRSQQLGLVVMDEAFSKLSGDGINDCLALARRFELQLVMAFPPERLGVMLPHAQTVVMCQKTTEQDRDGYITKITNIPMLTTMAAAMEALA